MQIRTGLPLPFSLAAIGSSLSGACYCLGYPGNDVWPLAFVAFSPLWISLQGQTPRRALWLGVIQGTVMNVGGFYWLQSMLMTFSGFPAPLCALFTVIVCAYQGGRMGFLAWLHARATARGWPSAPVFIAAFVASELVYPLLFPWSFAASLHKLAAFTQIAELGGPILVGAVLVSINLAVAEPVLAFLEKRKLNIRLLAGAGLATALTLAFGAWRIPAIDARAAESEAVHVGIVQGNMGLMQKREDPGEGLRRHIRMTRELKDKGVELVVWSESSATFPMRDNMYKASMRDYVGRHLGVSSIVGGVIYRFDPDRERWFNVALSMDETGEVLGRYDKQYLLAFGEHIPFSETFPILNEWSPNSGKFSAGTSIEPVDVRVRGVDHRVSVLICYEDILADFTNGMIAHANPELIVNITNDAWFGDTAEPWEHLALAKLRAVEHRRYLVRSTNSGVSAIIDPVGRVVVNGGTFRAEHLDAIVRFMHASTVYELVGNAPWWLVTLALGTAAFARRRRKSDSGGVTDEPAQTAA
jgi:apolipoprotein N-acyltransferase